MNKWLFLALMAIAVTLGSCDKDDNFLFDPDLMHLDGANDNAPNLPPGFSELAVQFDGDVLKNYDGKHIDAIQFFVYNIPDEARLVIYGKGGSNTPGSIIYEQVVTAQMGPDTWNTVFLPELIEVPSDELWIGLQVQLNQPVQVLGCDAGPNREGGDWMYESSDGQWRTFRSRSGDSINWNIRASITD